MSPPPVAYTRINPRIWKTTPPQSSPDSEATLGRNNAKIRKVKLRDKVGSSHTSSSISGADDEDSAEEEIVTAGAQATLNNPQQARPAPRLNVYYEGHREPGGENSSEEESVESESEESDEEPSVEGTKPRHIGFPPVEELPEWFPENIKEMYRVDRHGGSLSYKESSLSIPILTSNNLQELNEITRYRAALEIIYRRKWRKYIKAGRARWQLQQALHHLKCRPLTKAFYKYRKEQFRYWKAKGLRLWKRLEKTHRGFLILEETININFRQERIIHEKKLGGERM
jgi:hypothetical protein